MPFLLPLMLQVGFGLTPLQSGLITFAAAVGALVMKTARRRILRRFGFRTRADRQRVISAALPRRHARCSSPSTPHRRILAVLLVGGFFRSLQFTASTRSPMPTCRRRA